MSAALRRACGLFVSAAIVVGIVASPGGAAASSDPTALAAGKVVSVRDAADGAKRLKYRIGPFTIKPGQNDIGYRPILERPQQDGYFTRIRPDLTYLDGTVPGVDVLHLHHGVWLNLANRDATAPNVPERFFATGEEKTHTRLPPGYGYPVRRSDPLLLNHMIHNLTPVPAQVYMVYEVDFVPARSKAGKRIRPVRPIWMDVRNGELYPVFNVPKGGGSGGTYTYPDDAGNPYRGGAKLNEWVVDRPGVLVSTAGHLHPGGLYTDLYLRRRGARIRRARCEREKTAAARARCRRTSPRGTGSTVHLFRSKARYFEPAGAVSWDVAMTSSRRGWRVRLRRGDVLSVKATYDSSRGAWWESMGINDLTYMAETGRGTNPFKRRVDLPGTVTHGHLAENDNHGGGPTGMPDPRALPDGISNPGTVPLVNFKYTLGDLSMPAPAGLPPVIAAGQTLTFKDGGDDARGIYHSITSCKAPCNRAAGIAYPIADGEVQFESGTLGSAAPPATGALEWKTPDNLGPGTYTYFCRIHPFMRGSFRVKG